MGRIRDYKARRFCDQRNEAKPNNRATMKAPAEELMLQEKKARLVRAVSEGDFERKDRKSRIVR
jgi:hypothetical protein